ncbi:sensor histidine kinase [Paenibacillus oralis]|uniref:Sensor histidine kinase n=1 Tax=Paenibacillus oralis TaxID=2490856 RepID=A0A3P3U4U5_9BACL|nr:sensor histidine kinase [Paenibacillus oralis]RRJ64608.1 sensor histidine kinase [Paenibacillus oralis]
MKRLYLDLSIRLKIFVIFYSVITIITLSIGIYSYQTVKKQIIDKVSTTNIGMIAQIGNGISAMRKQVEDWATIFISSQPVQSKLSQNGSSGESLENTLYDGPTASIMAYMLTTSIFDYLSLYGTADSPVFIESTGNGGTPYPLSNIYKSPIYSKVKQNNGAPYWFSLTENQNIFFHDDQSEMIGMSRIVRNVYNGNHIGLLFVGIHSDTVRKFYLKNLYDDEHGIVMLDQNGTPLLQAGMPQYQTDEFFNVLNGMDVQTQTGTEIVSINGEKLLVTYSTMDSLGWRVFYMVPFAFLTNELSTIKEFALILIFVCLILSLPIMLVSTIFLTAPIKTLQKSMKRFQNGNFDERVDIKYRDEIGELGRGFNSMVSKISSLVNDVYLLKISEKEAELKALQAQINPHFLYNMLDTIFWEAQASGNKKISDMIISLSRLFRLNLNRGSSLTSVAKEKELIGHYLALQKMRFEEKLQYHIEIPTELDHYVILKLILQPFIENAIIHGIEKRHEGGTVKVTGHLVNDNLEFIIEDNGIGMDESTINKIMNYVPPSRSNLSSDTSGYGTHNVFARLQHFYNDGYTLSVESQIGVGTKVLLRIPIKSGLEREVIS